MRKYARYVIAVFGVVFAGFVVLQLRHRTPTPATRAVVPTAPNVVVHSKDGTTDRFNLSKDNVRVKFASMDSYADGKNKLISPTIVTDERGGDRTFTISSKEAVVGANEATFLLDGSVKLAASDGLEATAEHATYATSDSTVNAPGPIEFVRGRMKGTGVGMKYDNARDVMTILDQAVVHEAPDEHGAGGASITAGTVTFARREKYIQFERAVRIERGGQITEADLALAHLSADEKRIESIELHTNARINGAPGGTAGALESLVGNDMNLTYRADGESLEHAVISGDATVKLYGEQGKAGRQIAAKLLDIQLGPDGSTPVALVGREGVQLLFPAEQGTPERNIRAANLEAKGEPGKGLTRATFTGAVQFRERGAGVDRAASSTALDVGLKPGMSTIEDARFTHAVRFEEAKMAAQSAVGRYDPVKGTLELTGSEPGSAVPRVVTEQAAIDATRIDVTLAGPQVKAAGNVKSTLQPPKKDANAKAGAAKPETKMPAMLKQDQPVTVLADNLLYDDEKSSATYTGTARLFQGDTTIKGDTIVLDQKKGDLSAAGHAMSTSMREVVGKDKKTSRMQSTGTSNDLKYEDAARKLTYTGNAHLVGPEGDMSATRIELFLTESGDDVERAEGYTDGGDKLTLREQNRTTTGAQMTYTAAQETYVVKGLPAVVVDECGRETIGRTLTFVKSTDTIVVDGNQQIRTSTKGGSGKCS